MDGDRIADFLVLLRLRAGAAGSFVGPVRFHFLFDTHIRFLRLLVANIT